MSSPMAGYSTVVVEGNVVRVGEEFIPFERFDQFLRKDAVLMKPDFALNRYTDS